MAFAPKPGCPMCGMVATASHAPSNSPRSPTFPAGSTQPEVLWRDDNFTAYREKANPVSSKGHIIVAFKCVFIWFSPQDAGLNTNSSLHVPSMYTLVCNPHLIIACSVRPEIMCLVLQRLTAPGKRSQSGQTTPVRLTASFVTKFPSNN